VNLKSALDALTSVLFPAPRRICERILTNASHIPSAPNVLPRLKILRRRFAKDADGHLVPRRQAEPSNRLAGFAGWNFFAFDRARSLAIYDDTLFDAIVLMKYEEVASLGH
jgi:hypothetical protein